eukprot:c13135_g1_i1.p1 GENE.c13135_g1_i1~~c13135_g1_i1.p1  ORF type:complete len:183 (+),score=56.71 c13135_g1_i1:46-594(+)
MSQSGLRQAIDQIIKRKDRTIIVGIAWPGNRYQLEVPVITTILELKNQIRVLAGIPVEVQHLTYMNKSLRDHKTLKHYKIQNDRTILLTRLGGDVISKRLSNENKNENEYMGNCNYNNNPIISDNFKTPVILPNQTNSVERRSTKITSGDDMNSRTTSDNNDNDNIGGQNIKVRLSDRTQEE